MENESKEMIAGSQPTNEVAAWSPKEVMSQVNAIQQLMKEGMHIDEHYGIIPGCGDKPALLKPGAEKLCLMFRLAPKFEIQNIDLGDGHREVRIQCSLFHINTEKFWGSGVGSCSTMETKYRYRGESSEDTGQMVPREYWDLRKADPKKAQAMLGEGFGTKKIDGMWHIVKKTGEKIENPDIADTYNTVLKMAKKRSLVDATLTATAASDIFTQDIDENLKTSEVTVHEELPKAAEQAKPVEEASQPLKKEKEDGGINPIKSKTTRVKGVQAFKKKKDGTPYWKMRDLDTALYYIFYESFATVAIAAEKSKDLVTIQFQDQKGGDNYTRLMGIRLATAETVGAK